MIPLLIACADGAQLPTADIVVDGHTVTVEIADEPGERQIGLMYRDALAADRGMLFVYPDTRARSFWMKDTRIALTIAYIDSAGIIVHLADMTPLATTSVPSPLPAMYALEMNKGWFSAHAVAIGDRVGGLPTSARPEP